MKNVIRYISHPFILAIPLALLILALIPPLFNKYNGSIESVFVSGQNQMSKICYIDIDNNGYSEKVLIYRWQNNSTNIKIFNNNDLVIDEYNFDGLFHFNFDLFNGDFDNNKLEELYFFTFEQDSLIYINQLELSDSFKYKKNRKLTAKITLHNKKLDSNAYIAGVVDLNNDGRKEIVFFITSGYSLQPRNVYAWDVKNDTIISSPESYARISWVELEDLDNDGMMEIIISTAATGNTKNPNLPFNDQSAWLMVLDNQLKHKYMPLEFKGYGNNPMFKLIRKNNKKLILVLAQNLLAGKEYSKLLLYDDTLNLLREKRIETGYHITSRDYINNQRNSIFYNDHAKLVLEFDFELNKINNYSIKPFVYLQMVSDINLDGNKECFFWNRGMDKIIITQNKLAYPVEYNIPESVGPNFMNYSLKLNGTSPNQLSIQRGNKNYLLNYTQNPLFYLKYPLYIAIYGVFVLFFYLLQKLQKKRIEEKYSTEREITQLQIRTIKNQADPHFIFNALNSISSIIYKEDKDTAYDVLNDFSALIRSAIVNSDKIRISLAEELDFIENYLKLEKIRFKDKFDFIIDLDEKVNKQVSIPRMVIQTYVENAIKHGIMHADYSCLLKVLINQNQEMLKITVEDNGIGREKSKQFASYGTGKGLEIMNTIYALYHKLYGKKIKHIIQDKKTRKNDAMGTKVEVHIPL